MRDRLIPPAPLSPATRDRIRSELGAPRLYKLPRTKGKDLTFSGWKIGSYATTAFVRTLVRVYATTGGSIVGYIAHKERAPSVRYTLRRGHASKVPAEVFRLIGDGPAGREAWKIACELAPELEAAMLEQVE